MAFFATVSFTHAQIIGADVVCLYSTNYYTTGYSQLTSWHVSGPHTYMMLPDKRLQIIWKSEGNFTITANYLSNGQILSQTFNVDVNPLPDPLITSLNSTLCNSIVPAGLRIRERRPNGSQEDNLCYMVCDSGWYYFSVSGSVSSSYTWSTSGAANIIPVNSIGDTVKVRWFGGGYTDLTVTETDVNGCSNTDDICIQIVQSPNSCFSSAPQADANGVINLCLNATLSLNSNCSTTPFGSNIVSRRWAWGDGTVTNNDSYAEHVYTQAGQYTVMLIVESNCACKDTFFRIVNVSSSPGPDIFCVNSVCHDSVSVFSTSSTCNSLLWSVSGGSFASGSSSTNDSITVIWGNGNAGFGTVSLQANCGGACPYPTQVFVPILPSNAVISGRSVVCNNSTEVYSVPFVPTTQYVWESCDPNNPSNCSVIGSSNSIALQWITLGTLPRPVAILRVTYTNPFLGCWGQSTLPITVADGFNLLGDTVICQGSSATFLSRLGSTKVYCNWTLYSYGTGTSSAIQTNNHEATLSGLGVGNYVLSATSVDPEWCGNPVSINIRVVAAPPQPTSTIAGPDTVCPGALATYFTSPAPSGLYIDWQATTGTPSAGVGESFNTIWSGSLPGEVKLRYVTIAEPGCAGPWLSKNVYAMQVALPNINGATTLCGDDTVRYTINYDADNYKWEIINSEMGSIISGQYSKSVLVQWNHRTSNAAAQVKVTVTKCGSEYTKTLNVNLNASPVGSITAATSPFCVGETVTFTASPASSATTAPYYAWDFGDGTTPSNTTTGATNHTYNSEGTFNAKVTIHKPNGCQNPITVATGVNLLPGPAATLTTADATNQCGSSWGITLHTTLQNMNGAGFTYQLYKNGTAQGSIGTASSFTINQTGTYTVNVISATGCEKQTNAITITSNCGGGSGCTPTGTISVTASTPNCGSVTATATTGAGVSLTNIVFIDPTGSGLVATNSPAAYAYGKAGIYRIEVNGTETLPGGGTCAVEGHTTVTIPYIPDFTVQYACSANVMQTKLIDLSTYTAGNTITNWEWIIDGNTTTPNTAQNPVLNLSPGSHTVQLKINSTCTTALRTITVPAPAQASFNGVDSVCESNAVHFISTSTGNIISYLWDYGDLSYSSIPNSFKQFDCPAAFSYTTECYSPVTLTVADVYGCTHNTQQNQLVYDDKFSFLEFNLSPISVIICPSLSALVNVDKDPPQPTTGPFQYVWSNGTTGSSAAFPITYQAANSMEYSITITDKYGCVNRPAQKSAVLVDDVSANILGDTLYCINDFVNLITFKGYNYTYAWQFASGNPPVFSNYTQPLPKPYLFNPKMLAGMQGWKIRGSLTSPNGCTALSDTVTLHHYPAANVPVSITQNPNSYCASDLPITISATSGDASGFLWSNGVYGSSIVADVPGTYTLQKIDTNGCKKDSLKQVKLVSGPDFSQLITGCYTRCIGSNNVLLGPQPPLGSIYTYQWILNDSAVVSTQTNYDPAQSGTYRLVITETISGTTPAIVCTDTSAPIYLTLELCPNTWCVPEGIDTSCIGCHYDSLHNTRVMEFILTFYYTGNTAAAFNVLCNTADVNAFDNRINSGGTMQSLGHTVQHGWNYLRVELWDTAPQQPQHELYIIIGSCQIPVTIQSPSPCH